MNAAQNQTAAKGQVRIFACGGAATNIARAFEPHRGATRAGFASIDAVYIDTSRSNLNNEIPRDAVYLIDGLDGSGKVRRENANEIANHSANILNTHGPVDLNIVLSSLAGGSGSVIAPTIAGELLAMGQNVIIIGVGGTDAALDIENTMKTLKSYESLAQLHETPIIMSYFENSNENPRRKIDAAVVDMIMMLAILFSRENKELDSRDLYNFLRFTNVVSGAHPQLAALSLIEGTNTIPQIGNIFSVATLATEETGTALSETPDYQAVGYMPAEAAVKALQQAPIHFVTSDGVFPAHVVRFQGILDQRSKSTQARSALTKRDTVLNNADKPNAKGLVL